MSNFSESEVYKFWDTFKNGNQLTEIRLIANDGRTASGYFTDPKTMIDAVRPYVNDFSVYFTINAINPDVYGRPQRDRILLRAKNTTTDAECIGRDYVLIDLDSRRATGVNATDKQLEAAKQKANQVYKYLRDSGFYSPIVICSGSGVHLYLRCALLNNEENTKLVKRFLQSLSMLFSDDSVDIDTSVHNASRIARVCGYYNRKGTNADDERPQRMCEFVKIPNEIQVNPKEYFEKIAAMYPEEEVRPSWQNNYSTQAFDLDAFIAKHNIPVTGKVEVADGTRYYLEHCLFNPQHKNKDAILFKHHRGGIAYFCYHSSCSGNDWRKVRLMYEPDAYDYASRKQYSTQQFAPQPKVFEPIKETEEKGKKWLSMKDIKRVDIDQLLTIPTGYHELDRKIVGLFAGELTIVSGLNASGKTSWLDCLALNVIQSGFKVAIWSGEMQDWRFQGWINQIAAGKNFVRKKEGYDNLYYTPNQYCDKISEWLDGRLFLYNNSYGSKWGQLFNDVKEVVSQEGVQLIVLDNLASMDINDYDGDKYAKQTQFIIDLKEYAKNSNVHVIMVAHPRKQNDLLRKESISGTADLTNLADNVFILHRVGRDFETRGTEFFGQEKTLEFLKYGNVLEVCKNRQLGIVDHLVGMYYEPESRRLKNDIAEHIVYGWQEESESNAYNSSSNDSFYAAGADDFENGYFLEPPF